MVRKAFTMLELVMVMVVLGIVASIGAEMITSLYENYLKTRAIERLQMQTELVLNQIANRLQYRIKDSVIGRNSINFADYQTLSNAEGNYTILEWISKDNESFLGEHNGTHNVPGWSGFVDLDSNDTTSSATPPRIKTRGSRLDFAENIMNALSGGTVSLNPGLKSPALIFKGKDSYDMSQYGWNGVDGNYTHRVQRNGVDVLEFIEATPPSEIFEQYDLAWSAYAIVPQGDNPDDFNLTLHYNYQPWHDEDYTDGDVSILVEHVSTFRFTQIGDTLRIKLCISDANRSGTFDFAFCKEKVIY